MAVTLQQIARVKSQIEALNTAISDGVRQVTLPGGMVTIYNTTESLIKARDDAERRLAKLEADYATENGQVSKKAPRMYPLTYAGRGY